MPVHGYTYGAHLVTEPEGLTRGEAITTETSTTSTSSSTSTPPYHYDDDMTSPWKHYPTTAGPYGTTAGAISRADYLTSANFVRTSANAITQAQAIEIDCLSPDADHTSGHCADAVTVVTIVVSAETAAAVVENPCAALGDQECDVNDHDGCGASVVESQGVPIKLELKQIVQTAVTILQSTPCNTSSGSVDDVGHEHEHEEDVAEGQCSATAGAEVAVSPIQCGVAEESARRGLKAWQTVSKEDWRSQQHREAEAQHARALASGDTTYPSYVQVSVTVGLNSAADFDTSTLMNADVVSSVNAAVATAAQNEGVTGSSEAADFSNPTVVYIIEFTFSNGAGSDLASSILATAAGHISITAQTTTTPAPTTTVAPEDNLPIILGATLGAVAVGAIVAVVVVVVLKKKQDETQKTVPLATVAAEDGTVGGPANKADKNGPSKGKAANKVHPESANEKEEEPDPMAVGGSAATPDDEKMHPL